MALFNQFFPQQTRYNSSNTQIDQQQFNQLAVTLDKRSLQDLVQKARQKGISEQDIKDGLNYILNLK